MKRHKSNPIASSGVKLSEKSEDLQTYILRDRYEVRDINCQNENETIHFPSVGIIGTLCTIKGCYSHNGK